MKHTVKTFICYDMARISVQFIFVNNEIKYGESVIKYLTLVLAQDIDFPMKLSGNIVGNSSAISSEERIENFAKTTLMHNEFLHELQRR